MSEVPLDTGWAWACLVGSHVANLFLIGGFKSLGVLIVEFTDAFDVPLASATVMLGLIGGAMSILSPIGTALGERYTNRVVVVTGGIFMALAAFVTSFAVSMTMVIFSFGILTGIGYGCVFGPSNVVIGQYFRARRSLASGIAVAGGSIGQLVIPLMLRKLIDEYTWRGALFIYSAIILHVVVGAMLFRPLSFYTRRKIKKSESAVEKGLPESQTILSEIVENGNPQIQASHDGGCNGVNNIQESEPMLNSKPVFRSSENCSNGVLVHSQEDLATINKSSAQKALRKSSVSLNILEVRQRHKDIVLDQYLNPKYTSTGSLCFISYPSDLEDAACIQQQPSTDATKTAEEEERKKVSFLDVLKISFCGCCVKKGSISKKESLFDWPLFKNRLFLMYIIGVGLGNTGFVNLFMFIPKMAEDVGFDRQSAALLISIGGFCDLFSRVAGGWFADLGYIKRHNIMAITIFLTGVSSFVAPHVSAFPALIVYVSLVGMMGGFYAALFLVVLIDLIGLERTPKGFGMTLMVMGFINMPMPILLGYLRDVTGNCIASFSVCATMMTLCSIVFSSEPIVRKLEERRVAKLQSETQ